LLHALLKRSIRTASAVTAASESTASWLRERYGIDPPVIPPGIDPFFLEAGSPLEGPAYLLHPATGDRRENTDLVLRAYAATQPPAMLTLVGAAKREAAALVVRADSLGIPRDRIRVAGWVSDEELRDLYRGAVALVHPARYEGFVGLQPLEAMAQGTPVIALDAAGVSEALSGVAELVPESVSSLGSAMRRLCDDRARLDLGARGKAFAAALTWERAARRFVDVLASLPSPHP
jgi:glycosyltransferase involved in cell wall biosynthesis